jgi:hypothetical protein
MNTFIESIKCNDMNFKGAIKCHLFEYIIAEGGFSGG